MQTIEVLQSNELFKGLNDLELQHIVELMAHKTVPKNTLLISEGDDSDSLFLIKKGKVNVLIANEEGKEMILSTLHEGEHFGELSLLDGEPRSANVITLEKCEFLVLHRANFNHLLEQHPSIAMRMIKYLCQRVRLLTSIAQGLALLDVYGRLVKLLNSLAEPSSEGLMVINLPLTHKDIAARVGSSREMISRIFSELERGRYLTVEHKIITIQKKLPSAW